MALFEDDWIIPWLDITDNWVVFNNFNRESFGVEISNKHKSTVEELFTETKY